METSDLIRWLDNICHRLKNRTYRERRSTIGQFSGLRIDLPPVTKQRYDVEELLNMYEQKQKIITELHGRGHISSDEMAKYWLAEDPKFTPEIDVELR